MSYVVYLHTISAVRGNRQMKSLNRKSLSDLELLNLCAQCLHPCLHDYTKSFQSELGAFESRGVFDNPSEEGCL